MGIGMAGGSFDFLIGCAGAAQLDVPANCIVEQNSFLCDQANLAAQIFDRNIANVRIPDENSTFLGIVKAQEKIGYGCFPRSTAPNQRQELSRFYRQLNLPEDLFLFICKVDALKANGCSGCDQRLRVWWIQNRAVRIEKLKNPVAGRARLL